MPPRKLEAVNSALEKELEARLLHVGQGNLGDQDLDQHGGHGPVELADDFKDIRPLLAGAPEQEHVAVLVDDDPVAGSCHVAGDARLT